jgi:hypothetical protein
MGKYNSYSSRATTPPKKKEQVHPIWRGIGCLLMLLIPIMAYAGAIVLMRVNRAEAWIPIPRELARTVAVPLLGNIPNLYATLILTVLLALIGFGVVMIFYTVIYSLVGPSRYGPLDSPPIYRRRQAGR